MVAVAFAFSELIQTHRSGAPFIERILLDEWDSTNPTRAVILMTRNAVKGRKDLWLPLQLLLPSRLRHNTGGAPGSGFSDPG